MCVCVIFFFKDFERKDDDDDDDDDDVENSQSRSDSRGFFFCVFLQSESTRERDGEMPRRAGAG